MHTFDNQSKLYYYYSNSQTTHLVGRFLYWFKTNLSWICANIFSWQCAYVIWNYKKKLFMTSSVLVGWWNQIIIKNQKKNNWQTQANCAHGNRTISFSSLCLSFLSTCFNLTTFQETVKLAMKTKPSNCIPI